MISVNAVSDKKRSERQVFLIFAHNLITPRQRGRTVNIIYKIYM